MSDVSASSVYQTLLDEINRGNDLSLQLDQVTFGVPVLLDATVDDMNHPTRRNSRVKVSAGRPGNGYLEVMANYNRLNLAQLVKLGVQVPLIPNGALVDYLPVLNQQLKTTLTVGDLQDVAVTAGTVQLVANPNSLYVIGSGSITVGEVAAPSARIKLMMAQGSSEMYLINPDGTRTMVDYDYVNPTTPELDGRVALARESARMQMVVKLVDENDVPLPVEQQPEFDIDVSDFYSTQIIDGPTLIEAIKAYDDAGIPYPTWYSPGCWMAAASLYSARQDTTVRVSVVGESNVAPVSFVWRQPAFKAEFSITRIYDNNGLKVPPESTPPTGKVYLSFPNPNKNLDGITTPVYMQDDAVILPGSGISGGVLRMVDNCSSFGGGSSARSTNYIAVEGQITECTDVPEWVGKAMINSHTGAVMNYACTLDHAIDTSTAVLTLDDPESKNVRLSQLSYPDGRWPMDFGIHFHLPDIQGLQFEYYPFDELPNNNG